MGKTKFITLKQARLNQANLVALCTLTPLNTAGQEEMKSCLKSIESEYNPPINMGTVASNAESIKQSNKSASFAPLHFVKSTISDSYCFPKFNAFEQPQQPRMVITPQVPLGRPYPW